MELRKKSRNCFSQIRGRSEERVGESEICRSMCFRIWELPSEIAPLISEQYKHVLFLGVFRLQFSGRCWADDNRIRFWHWTLDRRCGELWNRQLGSRRTHVDEYSDYAVKTCKWRRLVHKREQHELEHDWLIQTLRCTTPKTVPWNAN